MKGLGGNGTTTPSARTQAQTDLAWFFTVNPAPMYYAGFRAVAKAEGLSLVEQARLFGLLGLSGADSFINCWNDKAHYSFWRPITAIRLGDSDTNAETVGDASWTSLVAGTAVSGSSVGLQLHHRRVDAHRQGVLRQRDVVHAECDADHRGRADPDDAELQALHGRARGHDRRRACTRAFTSGRPTSKARSSGSMSPTGSGSTNSNRWTTDDDDDEWARAKAAPPH